ncbi:hypothetical protein [Vibrio cyclitrophicus]|uniref:Uncharacterized protein n=2 Tax=Vibrio cyclitrophicus TaxID=47951 RepID=A0A7Z1S3A5_9VIBR|nr:hypothetical protein [Vibrio cyclitrophicus]PMP21143.1 hypothetical protein BCS91_20655 [Vibrio cyclitrophicus]PMP30548.1 hypothetical protein BCS90_14705 [Vibrio cyclitrophicus]
MKMNAIIALMTGVLLSIGSPAYAKSLTQSALAGDRLTMEDFDYAMAHPDSDKYQEVVTNLNGMQDAVSFIYNAQKSTPESLLFCLPASDDSFATWSKPNWFMEIIQYVKVREPDLLAGRWSQKPLTSVVFYGLKNLYPCTSFDFPTMKSGLAMPHTLR